MNKLEVRASRDKLLKHLQDMVDIGQENKCTKFNMCLDTHVESIKAEYGLDKRDMHQFALMLFFCIREYLKVQPDEIDSVTYEINSVKQEYPGMFVNVNVMTIEVIKIDKTKGERIRVAYNILNHDGITEKGVDGIEEDK
jgi:hypothetical protein